MINFGTIEGLILEMTADAKDALKTAIKLSGDPTRNGGYLCVSAPTGLVLAIALIGDVPKHEKAVKYIAFCQEKNWRLFLNPSHVSSFESRNEKMDMYGGAIRTNDFNLSFSGLQDDRLDEALVLEVACRNPSIRFSMMTYAKIIRASNNVFATDDFANYRDRP